MFALVFVITALNILVYNCFGHFHDCFSQIRIYAATERKAPLTLGPAPLQPFFSFSSLVLVGTQRYVQSDLRLSSDGK